VKARGVRAVVQRLAAAFLIAAILGIGIVPALAPVPASAATPNLTLVGAATYDVLPSEGRVAVTVKLTASNHLKNTVTKKYYFRTAFLTVLPGTSGFKLTGPHGKPRVSVAKKTADYTNLKLDFGANLAAGKSTELTLTFSITDPGGAPDRAVRISSSIVSFAAWAYATPDTPGATVTVQLPTGYTTTVRRGPLDGPTPDAAGHDVFSSGTLAKPLEFVADIAADRPADYAETTLAVEVADGHATVLLRAWPDDPEWRDRVGTLITEALPILERDIGIPWPVHGPLAVHEALIRSTGGFAGVFAPADNRIDIAYAASDSIVIHELAHAWFNGGLVADRWEAEAFASYYAAKAATELGIQPDPRVSQISDRGSPPAIPLNAWGPSDATDAATEQWAYQASSALGGMIVQRAGADAMARVWSKAASGIGAYQPPSAETPEAATGIPDWRGLLDLLEAETGKDFGDLWRTWVARRDDLQALADRAITTGWYARSLQLAGDWPLPASVRAAMRTWQVQAARDQLAVADAALAQQAALVEAASAAKVTLPDRVRAAFVGPGGPEAARAEAAAELAVVESITAAEAARPAATGVGELVVRGGLLSATPEADLAAARAALAGGDVDAAFAAAKDAETGWTVAPEVGRGRIVSVALLVAALVLLLGLIRQHRRRGTAHGAGATTAANVGEG
jgi:hypothetical protein